jgi:hypothetical protein
MGENRGGAQSFVRESALSQARSRSTFAHGTNVWGQQCQQLPNS